MFGKAGIIQQSFPFGNSIPAVLNTVTIFSNYVLQLNRTITGRSDQQNHNNLYLIGTIIF